MEENWQKKIRKLALAYETGWEYREGSEEAGSVIAGICLDMYEENRSRFSGIWEKQSREFLRAVPERREKPALLRGSIVIEPDSLEGETYIPGGTGLYGVSDTGQVLCFRTQEPVTAVPARLAKAFYSDGYNTWSQYDADKGEEMRFCPSEPSGEPMERPTFEWRYRNIGNCMAKCLFRPVFEGDEDKTARFFAGEDSVRLRIFDGLHTYPLHSVEREEGIYWEGAAEAFADNREETVYTVSAVVMDVAGLSGLDWDKLVRGPVLWEAGRREAPQLYIMDEEESAGAPVIPFSMEPEASACCFVACDGILGREKGEFTLHVEEEYLSEEVLPEPKSEKYKKKMKKYAWMLEEDKVLEWKAADTVWEYFNGEIWCMLGDSEAWQTGCRKVAGQYRYPFERPADMSPCVVEGSEHYYVRLRLRRSDNAYALYYHKTVPVLKSIFLESPDREHRPIGERERDVGSGGAAAGLYLAFTNSLPKESTLYVEAKTVSGEEESVAGREWRVPESAYHGWDTCFGTRAYYVVVPAEAQKREIPDGEVTLLACNYVKVVQEETAEENSPEEIQMEGKICEGVSLAGETRSKIPFEARAVKQDFIRADGGREADPLLAARNYFYRFDRLVTAEDIISLCRERYPELADISCSVEEGEVPLLKICFAVKASVREEKELIGAIREQLREWLSDAVKREGNLLLSQYEIQVTAIEQDTGKRDYAGAEEAG